MTEQTAGPEKASILEDFVDVFLSPVALFRRRADGRFGVAILVFMIAGAVLYFATRNAMQPVWDAEFDRGMAAALKANPQMTQEQMEAGRKIAGTFGAVFVVIGAPIAALMLGFVVSIVGKLLGSSLGFGQGFAIGAYSLFPRLFEGVAGALQATRLDPASITSRMSVSLGVGRFLDPDQTNPMLFALAGRIDVFTLWVTLLIGIGFKVIGKMSTGQAALGAVIVWFVGALPALFQAFRAM
ncbi:MAG: YIP1 family protein [Gemmatimonadales bacterium]